MATILIVEDDRNMRLLTAARLGDLYTTVCACDGVEALELIHKGGIDMIMPSGGLCSYYAEKGGLIIGF